MFETIMWNVIYNELQYYKRHFLKKNMVWRIADDVKLYGTSRHACMYIRRAL